MKINFFAFLILLSLQACQFGQPTTIAKTYPSSYTFEIKNKKQAFSHILAELTNRNFEISVSDYDGGIITTKTKTFASHMTTEAARELLKTDWWVCDCSFNQKTQQLSQNAFTDASLSVIITDTHITIKWVNLRTYVMAGNEVFNTHRSFSTGQLEKTLAENF